MNGGIRGHLPEGKQEGCGEGAVVAALAVDPLMGTPVTEGLAGLGAVLGRERSCPGRAARSLGSFL